ncbi:substrate-binding domain-containing protein [Desulforamulus aeronauticus]|uniref:substrate-binding domain-containing protein n=1 Tax=Desulforamulus aeronauticus TaxID=53343 RepID=UPI001A9A6AD6|nr:substrate-binding domain-containing protein [Desulforamulus aeronauticus]
MPTTEAGLKAPADIALVGYDGIALWKYVYPKLTTVLQPTYEIRGMAVQGIVKSHSHNEIISPYMEVKLILKIRDSSLRRKTFDNT